MRCIGFIPMEDGVRAGWCVMKKASAAASDWSQGLKASTIPFRDGHQPCRIASYEQSFSASALAPQSKR
jgi:hypothetical protein